MTIIGLLFLIVIGCLFANYLFKRRKLYYHAMKFNGPPTLPFIGSAFYLIGGKKKAMSNVVYLMKKYKAPWKIWLGRWLYIVLTKPEDIEIILNNSLEKARNYKFVKPILREGLFTSSVRKWKPHRKVITATFGMSILNSFVDIFSEHSQNLLPKLDNFTNKGYFDVFPLMTQCALEITCETAMGGNSNQQQENVQFVKSFGRAMEIVYWRMFNYWFHMDFMWRLTPYARKLDKLTAEISKFVQTIVTNKKLEYHELKKLQERDWCQDTRIKRKKYFLDHLIELSEEGENWTDEELMEEAQTMVAAGSESIGFVESYVLAMLGMYPNVQEKVHAELYDIYGEDHRNVTHEDLSRMVYLDRVIKETLRLFPVSAALARRVETDIPIDSYVIPQGCECFIAILYTHRNHEIWTDPLCFDPDRFLPEQVEKRHPYSYLPFSRGPRNCIGYKYALMAIKTTVATIVRNFKITTDFKRVADIEFIPGVLLKPSKGHRIALERRT